jgi:hypothetical protein
MTTPFNLSPQYEQISIGKVPTIFFLVDIVIRSPSNKRPRTTPKPSTQMTKGMKPLQTVAYKSNSSLGA